VPGQQFNAVIDRIAELVSSRQRSIKALVDFACRRYRIKRRDSNNSANYVADIAWKGQSVKRALARLSW